MSTHKIYKKLFAKYLTPVFRDAGFSGPEISSPFLRYRKETSNAFQLITIQTDKSGSFCFRIAVCSCEKPLPATFRGRNLEFSSLSCGHFRKSVTLLNKPGVKPNAVTEWYGVRLIEMVLPRSVMEWIAKRQVKTALKNIPYLFRYFDDLKLNEGVRIYEKLDAIEFLDS